MKIQLATLLAIMAAFAASAAQPLIPEYPTLDDERSFSMIVISDPQSYVKFAANQPLFELQTAWTAQNLDRLNIAAVLFTGDMVEQNNSPEAVGLPHYYNGDCSSSAQWEAVDRALTRLDHRVPYMICQGNHDAGYVSSESRISSLPEVYYPERNVKFQSTLVSTAPNYTGIHTMENAAFELDCPNWGKLLIVNWEFSPRDEVLHWTRDLIESDRFKDHRVIILTHSFIEYDNQIFAEEGYSLQPRNWPQAVWDKLIAPSHNIDLIVCGHAGIPPKIPEGTTSTDQIDYSVTRGFRTQLADDGRQIPIMMFNAQAADGEWHGNGGDGWLRILEFKPDGHTVAVKTFSPLFALSKLTRHLSYRTAPTDQFEFQVP